VRTEASDAGGSFRSLFGVHVRIGNAKVVEERKRLRRLEHGLNFGAGHPPCTRRSLQLFLDVPGCKAPCAKSAILSLGERP
jgi:hypothetical protein